MQKPTDNEPNFIERKRAWRSGLEKQSNRTLLISALPALGLCLFLVLASPMIKKFMDRFFNVKEENRIVRSLDVAEEKPAVDLSAPPPNPDLIGLPDLKEANLPIPKPTLQEARPDVLIKPVAVELPATMMSSQAKTPGAGGLGEE